MIRVAVYGVPLPMPGMPYALVAARLLHDDGRNHLAIVELDTRTWEIVRVGPETLTDEERAAVDRNLELLGRAARGEFLHLVEGT